MAQSEPRATVRSHLAAIACYCLAPLMVVSSSHALACPIINNEAIQITANEHELTAELATDPASHRCGLAFRNDLPSDHAMLFVFPREQFVGFWMKDTSIPLSIAFLDRDGRILEIHDMDPPDSTRRYLSRSPVRYALEVNQGWFSDNGIEVGDWLEFDRSR